MGLIKIELQGSFATRVPREISERDGNMSGEPVQLYKSYSAMEHGHADAIEAAIDFLQNTVLPKAINLDMFLAKIHNQKPSMGFGPTVTKRLEGQ